MPTFTIERDYMDIKGHDRVVAELDNGRELSITFSSGFGIAVEDVNAPLRPSFTLTPVTGTRLIIEPA